jgi:hypothetical protein
VEEAKYPLCDNSTVYIIPDDTNVKMPPDMTNPAMFFVKYIKDYFPNIDRPEAFG